MGNIIKIFSVFLYENFPLESEISFWRKKYSKLRIMGYDSNNFGKITSGKIDNFEMILFKILWYLNTHTQIVKYGLPSLKE